MANKWRRFLVIYILTFLLIGCLGCFVLYKYLGVYEKTRPEMLMDSLIETVSVDEWYLKAKANCSLDVNEFENAAEIYDDYIHNSKIDNSHISYRKDLTTSDSKNSVFIVKSGITNVAQVTLVPDQKAGFGRYTWKLGDVSAPNILNNLNYVTVNVFCPENAGASINGKKISTDYLSADSPVFPPDILDYETDMDLPVKYVKYDIGKMYGSVKVSDSNNYEIPAVNFANELDYIIRPDIMYNLKITAPEDATVFINGVLVADENASISGELFEEVLQYTKGQEYNVITYIVDGLYNRPAVTAVDADGNSLEPLVSGNGRYSFLKRNDPKCQQEFESVVSDFFNKYTNYATEVFNVGTQSSLLNRCLRNGKLFKFFYEAEDALYWTREITTTYNEIKYDNFSMVGDECFVCSVEYKINQTSKGWTETTEEIQENAFELVFVKYGENWVCAKMDSISE